MEKFVPTFIVLYIAWIVFSLSIEPISLLVGVFVVVVVGLLTKDFLFYGEHYKVFHPRRWVYFTVFLVHLFVNEIKGHLDVAYRIVTGRISPGIYRIPVNVQTDVGKTLLGNSITVTPGTLTVSVRDQNLFVHCLNCKKKPEIGRIEKLIRGAADD